MVTVGSFPRGKAERAWNWPLIPTSAEIKKGGTILSLPNISSWHNAKLIKHRDNVTFFGVGWDCVHLVRRQLFGLLYQSRIIDDDDCGAVGGMRIGRGNLSTRRKPASASVCPPQIPHDRTWDLTQAAAVGSRRLTTWAMARLVLYHFSQPWDSTHRACCFSGKASDFCLGGARFECLLGHRLYHILPFDDSGGYSPIILPFDTI
jgi:hypothetical protein